MKSIVIVLTLLDVTAAVSPLTSLPRELDQVDVEVSNVCKEGASCDNEEAMDLDPEKLSLLQTDLKVLEASLQAHENDPGKARASSSPEAVSTLQQSLPPPFFHFWGHVARRSHNLALEQSPKLPKLQTPSTEPYNLTAGAEAATYSQFGQDTMLLPILQHLGKGFFVESGAYDGEEGSNTLYYESKLGWHGLLVEPNPVSFSKLQAKHRRAYAYQGCLSPSDHAETLEFSGSSSLQDPLGRIDGDGAAKTTFSVDALPLHTLMEKVGQSTVDFWSLDIEGSESLVLKNTDFSKVEVGVLLIEMNKSDENNRGIREVMDKEGFQNIGHSNYPDGDGILDQIFVNPKYFQKRGLRVPSSASLEPQYRN